MTLSEAREGIYRQVVYERPGVKDEGIIVGVNDYVVMVRYRGDLAPKATCPADLTFSSAASSVSSSVGESSP